MGNSIRFRLILLLIVAFVLNGFAVVWHFVHDRGQLVAAATQDLLDNVRLIAAQQRTIEARADAVLNGLRSDPQLRPGGSERACSAALSDRLSRETALQNIGMALPNGDIACVAKRPAHAINIADRRYFQRVLQTSDTVLSGVVTDRTTGRPTVVFAKSNRDDQGRVSGVLFLTLDLQWLGAELTRMNLPDGSRLSIVDDSGNIAARHPDPEGFVGTNIASMPQFQRMHAMGGTGTLEDVGVDGELRLIAHATLLDAVPGPLRVVLSVPRTVVETPVLREGLTYLGINGGLLLAMLLLVVWGADRLLLQPLHRLVSAAQRFAAGDMNARSGLPHKRDEIGQLARTIDEASDAIAERERALAASEERFRRLSELSSDWIWETDEKLRSIYFSPSYYELTGEQPETALGITPHAFGGVTNHVLGDLMRARRSFRNIEYARQDRDGKTRWRSLSGEPILDAQGLFRGFRGTGRDITERKRHEEELRRQATTDALTGLPNRTLLRDRLEHALERAARAGQSVAVMQLDLDDFSQINDGLGHDTGDELLRLVAARLRACARPLDTVARLGGDEFVVMLEDLADEDTVQEVITRVRQGLAQPAWIGHLEVTAGAGIGVALFPRDGGDAATLLRNADTAMYHAKRAGGGGLHFFTPALNDSAARYLALRAQLQGALERGEFELHYQPIVDCGNRQIVGVEALLRWRREGALVAPGEFLDIAEETGLIVPIGDWVLRTACAQLQAWRSANGAAPHLSVNLSACQFRHGDLVRTIQQALAASGLAPGQLTLEVTESTMMSDIEASAVTLERIEALGVGISLDDFGTGHSSLAYLRRFPVSELKIDRSFVRDAVQSEDDAAIVAAVIELARALKLQVVAEGIETDVQARLLKGLGCRLMQGYLVGRPMPAADFEVLLTAEANNTRLGPDPKRYARPSPSGG